MTRTAKTHKKTPKNKTLKKTSTDYVVAIPSYNRSNVLAEKTLKTLKDGSVPPSKIHIFVANKQEYDKYAAAIPKNLYGKMIIGELGISNQRKFIRHYFKAGQKIVSCDDDVQGLFERVSDKKLRQIRNLDRFFKDAFKRIQKEGIFIWGVYPVCNPFFMKTDTTSSLKFIIGGLYGFINRPNDKDLELSGQAEQKEDIEQSILYYIKDGKILRFNRVAFKTKFHAPGGLGETKGRIEANRNAAKYLEKTYPQYVTLWTRPNGMTEVRLKAK